MLLSKELYKVGSALNQTASRVTELAGLALAGVVVATLGCQGALLIDAATFFLSALIIGFIRIGETAPEEKVTLRATYKSLLDGFSLIRSSRVLIAILLIGTLMNFMFVPLNTYGVPFITDYLKGGAEVLSIMNIIIVATLGLGSFLAPKIARISGKTQLIACGLIEGVSLCAYASGGYVANPFLQYTIVLAACAVIGFTAGIVNVVYNAAFLRLVPADYMARLSGISVAILVSSMPLGSLLCAALASALPVPAAIFASGVLSVILYLLLIRVKSLSAL
jgi:MFS transporter, DHA3 family, macrolide efflux protein